MDLPEAAADRGSPAMTRFITNLQRGTAARSRAAQSSAAELDRGATGREGAVGAPHCFRNSKLCE